MQGVAKLNCYWNQSGSVISDEPFSVLNYWREVLYNMDMVGAYENGTPGFARDIFRLFEDTDVIEKRIILMEGERAGLLVFGNDMDEAVYILMSYPDKK